MTTDSDRIDVSRPHSARVWDHWLGGKNNYEVDRALGDQIAGTFPHVVAMVRADRTFMRRAVSFLAGQGVRQYLDIGSGLPTSPNTHQVAQAAEPASRVVYVDNDPVVLAHARALLDSSPEGSCSYLDADLREPDRVLAGAGLDPDRPVAVTLMSLLHFVPELDEAVAIVRRLLEGFPPGSYLALTHATDELGGPKVKTAFEMWNENAAQPARPRGRDEVARVFDGLELLEPGVVSPPAWRPDGRDDEPAEVPLWAGVARKP
ncbi:SAM-dependent methyltransferase [Actinomadura parmotrematis]|uniref:SAM-dependent methyltransferase n=1 Tax=Actinomadura parmotrematis TaxID=2864039 RepID=A0ABS7FMS5_9ACTN|nr:SAM-dependent methyltransferase [Actinomadura parmotrematis]MBW8481678.1 SAM-dependent methyltransferase [Actinomadura parmotrematis]